MCFTKLDALAITIESLVVYLKVASRLINVAVSVYVGDELFCSQVILKAVCGKAKWCLYGYPFLIMCSP